MLLGASFKTTEPLAQVSVKFMNSQEAFAALKILPATPVPKSAFKWYIYNRENQRSGEHLAAPNGTESHRFDYSVRTATSLCLPYGAKHLVLGSDARDFDAPVADLRLDAAQNNAEKLLIGMEALMYTKISTTGSYVSGLTGAATLAWTDSGADLIEQFRGWRQAVFEACGVRPRHFACAQKAVDLAVNHPSVIDRIKYSGLQALNKDTVKNALAQLFELDEIIVSDVLKNTAQEAAADSMATVWGTTGLLFVKAAGMGLRSGPAYGRTFMVNEFSTKTLPRPELARGSLSAEEIESSWEFSQEFIAQDSTGDSMAGYLATGLYA